MSNAAFPNTWWRKDMHIPGASHWHLMGNERVRISADFKLYRINDRDYAAEDEARKSRMSRNGKGSKGGKGG